MEEAWKIGVFEPKIYYDYVRHPVATVDFKLHYIRNRQQNVLLNLDNRTFYTEKNYFGVIFAPFSELTSFLLFSELTFVLTFFRTYLFPVRCQISKISKIILENSSLFLTRIQNSNLVCAEE